MDQNYYQDKYLVNSSRWRDHDYSQPGWYFITICVRRRKCYLGQIKKGIMGLSYVGNIVCEEWLKTEQIRQNVRLDEFIVMPNHLHGIIEIYGNKHVETLRRNVSTNQISLRMSLISPRSGSLSEIIRSFKSACTKSIHQSGFAAFAWQERFYDHLIRINAESLNKIRYYIKHNLMMWERDRNNPLKLVSK